MLSRAAINPSNRYKEYYITGEEIEFLGLLQMQNLQVKEPIFDTKTKQKEITVLYEQQSGQYMRWHYYLCLILSFVLPCLKDSIGLSFYTTT